MLAKTYCLMRVIKNIDGEDCILLEKKIPKSVNIAFLKKYISHVMQIDMDKISVKNNIDEKDFDNEIKKAEDYED